MKLRMKMGVGGRKRRREAEWKRDKKIKYSNGKLLKNVSLSLHPLLVGSWH
jgi:hypothetical protein